MERYSRCCLDRDVWRHSCRVRRLALSLGREMGLEVSRIEYTASAALLHDIGKAAIPASVLSKAEGLTGDEYRMVQRHPVLGAKILGNGLQEMKNIARIVHAHHERWDGGGYPEGLAGTQIPYSARMISILDSYDAMTNDRPYRKGMTVSDALEEIEACAGSQFDPQIVPYFLDLKLLDQSS